jgi:hypothetical protein
LPAWCTEADVSGCIAGTQRLRDLPQARGGRTAAQVGDGLSDRADKIVLMVLLSLLSGAATAHAVGRALIHRGSVPEALEEMER